MSSGTTESPPSELNATFVPSSEMDGWPLLPEGVRPWNPTLTSAQVFFWRS